MQWFVLLRRVCVVGVALALFLPGCARYQTEPDRPPLSAPGSVGRVANNRCQTPIGQVLTAADRQVRWPGMRPQALALSPDGTLLAAAGKNQTLVLLNPANGRVQQTVPLSTRKTDSSTNVITARMSLTGLVFAPDGRRPYVAGNLGNRLHEMDTASGTTLRSWDTGVAPYDVDRCPEDVLNRILWRSMKAPDAPYPEWVIKAIQNED